MNKSLQVILLGIVFVVPIGILVFLSAFGDNRFDVPVYPVVTAPFEECTTDSKDKVADSILTPGNLHVSMFLEEPDERTVRDIQYSIERIQNALAQPVVFRSVSSQDVDLNVNNLVSPEELLYEMHCGFGTDTLGQYILTDSENRIRGFYGKDLKEVDRLIVEAKIILENEQRDAKK